jgi:hypothetical protein
MNIAHLGSWRDQPSSKHFLVGYDRESDQTKYTLSIPRSKESLLHKFFQFGSDDPGGFDSYKLSYTKASELVRLLGGETPPKGLDYFVECNIPEEQRVR